MQERIPTSDQLALMRRNVYYDPDVGYLYWTQGKPARAGKYIASHINQKAGCYKGDYPVLKMGGLLFKIHRIAWYLHYGMWPNGLLDHKNQNPHDNRIENLRPASRSQNAINSPIHRSSSTGVKGVRLMKTSTPNPWHAHIRVNGVQQHIGYFPTLAEAAHARLGRERELFGEFSTGA